MGSDAVSENSSPPNAAAGLNLDLNEQLISLRRSSRPS